MAQPFWLNRPSASLTPAALAQTSSSKRILIIAYTDYSFDARVKRHAEALAERGYSVDVICLASKAPIYGAVRLIGLPISRYRGHSRIRYIGKYVRFFVRATIVAAHLSRLRPYDVVIACSIPDAAVLSGLIPKLRGSRLILDIHDTMPELYTEKFPGRLGAAGAAALKLEERASAWLADRVFAVHDLHAQRLRETGIPCEKISVILNTPDPRLFSPRRLPECRTGEQFTVITHGTINRRLGLDTAVEAINLVRSRIPNLQYLILGPGEHKAGVKAHVRRLGLDGVVRFEDSVALERLAQALGRASVGLVPNEATPATQLMLPVKLLEYVSLGIPVAASTLRTVRHYFPEDAIGYFQPGSPDSLAETLLELYTHPEKRRGMSERAREVAKSISWEVQREILYDAVDLLLQVKGASIRHSPRG